MAVYTPSLPLVSVAFLNSNGGRLEPYATLKENIRSFRTRKSPRKFLEGLCLQYCHLLQQRTNMVLYYKILKSLIIMGCFIAAKMASVQ